MNSTEQNLDLAVAICAHNSQRTIHRCLESVAGLACRIVVVDSGSTDRTAEICRELGATVLHRDWQGHVAQKQFAIDQCRDCQWILLLDSDESLEPPLIESMRHALIQNDPAIDGWHVNRKIWFMGNWLHRTFQPEWRLRLFRSGKGHVAGVNPHDRIDVNGKTGFLRGDVRHDPWIDMTDMAIRHVRYAEIAARQARRASLLRLLFSPAAALFKQLILKGGILDGWRGIIVAGMTANATMLKHLFIAAARLSPRQESRP